MKRFTEKKEEKSSFINKTGIILFGAFLIIGILFYVSLGVVKSGENPASTNGVVTLSPGDITDFSFGIKEIIFSIVFAFLMVGFLLWVKSVIEKNAYLGIIIGIITTVILSYAFSLRYRGFYSTIFMVIVSLIVLIFLGFNFWKFKKNEDKDEED
ncbi:MAG: hypothetical protein AABX83_02400 [Nanoarchaeota archaeon]